MRLSKTMRRILKASGSAIAMLILINAEEAIAGTAQPTMNEPAVDQFGLELKSGRITLTTPVQISIGGEGDSALKIAYRYESTMLGFQGYRETGFPAIRFSQVTLNNNEFYDYYSVEYGGGSDTFRRASGTTDAFSAELSTGSTLVQSGSDLIFTDKFGNKLFSKINTNSFSSPNVDKASYSDGRELYFRYGASGNLYSVENNFGYSLRRYQSTVQAVNRAVDYCDPAAASLCTGLQGSRSSSFSDLSASQRNFTDAGGGVTSYRLVSITALDREPYCTVSSDYGGTLSCDAPLSGAYYYPAGLTLPGSIAESSSATYAPNLPPPPYTPGSNPSTHDDVRVASITKDGVISSYAYAKYPYGTYGQVNYNLPYRLAVTTTVNGVTYSYSMANKPNSTWRVSGRRYLEYSKDGLNRQTNFGFNDLKDLSSVTLPEGNSTQLIYDTRYNVSQRQTVPKPSSGQPTLATTYTYPSTCTPTTQATCNLPLSITDPQNNVSSYTYNSAGQVLTEARPAATAGGVSQVITNTYTMRTAYIKDASGAAVAAGPPISLLTRSATCQTQSSCAGTSDEVATAYDYGPVTGLNNLNLKGIGVTAANGQGTIETHWTCFQYNYFGEKIAETQPNAGLTSCP
jgi:YD repeat-containing protein